LAPTVPEERVKMSWVTIDRICQEEPDGKEHICGSPAEAR
jgi:hypothetical protein